MSQDVFQKALLKDADELKQRAHELYVNFLQNGPYTSKWKAVGMFSLGIPPLATITDIYTFCGVHRNSLFQMLCHSLRIHGEDCMI